MKIFLFLIFCIPWWLNYANCLQTESDTVTQAKFIVQEITKVTSALNENDYSKLVQVSKGLSTFAGVAGPAFAILAIILDKGDVKHQQLMNEFKRVHEGIEALHGRFDELKTFIQKQNAENKLDSNYQILEVLIGHFERGEISDITENYGKFENFDAMLNHFNGDNAPGIESLHILLYEHNHGALNELIALKNFYDKVFLEAYFAFSFACYHVRKKKGFTHSKALSECSKDQKNRYFSKLKTFDERFNKIFRDCKVNLHENMKKMIDKYLKNNHNRNDNLGLMNRIKNQIQIRYFWVDAVVVVYDEIYGHDNHQIYANIWMRQNGKNVVVMYENSYGIHVNTLPTRGVKESTIARRRPIAICLPWQASGNLPTIFFIK